jgi:hypothetical protein
MKMGYLLSLKKNEFNYTGNIYYPPTNKDYLIFQDYQNLPVKNQEPIYRDKVKQIIGQDKFEY